MPGKIVPTSKVHPSLFKKPHFVDHRKRQMERHNSVSILGYDLFLNAQSWRAFFFRSIPKNRTPDQEEKRIKRVQQRNQQRKKKLQGLGIDYEFPTYHVRLL